MSNFHQIILITAHTRILFLAYERTDGMVQFLLQSMRGERQLRRFLRSEIKLNCPLEREQQLMLGILCMASSRQKVHPKVLSKNKINRRKSNKLN